MLGVKCNCWPNSGESLKANRQQATHATPANRQFNGVGLAEGQQTLAEITTKPARNRPSIQVRRGRSAAGLRKEITGAAGGLTPLRSAL